MQLISRICTVLPPICLEMRDIPLYIFPLQPCHSICLISVPSKIVVPDDTLLHNSSFSFQCYQVKWKYRNELLLSLHLLLAAETKVVKPWIYHLWFGIVLGSFLFGWLLLSRFGAVFCLNVEMCTSESLIKISHNCLNICGYQWTGKHYTVNIYLSLKFHFMQQWIFHIESVSFLTI